MSPEQMMQELGITLPVPPEPLGAYVEAVQAGELLFLSGTLPLEAGTVRYKGRIGEDLTIDDGRSAVRLATLNALAIARGHLGSLDKVKRVVRLSVSLVATPDFLEHPLVADAASKLLAEVFRPQKASTRMVSGSLSLPLGVCAVVEVVLAVQTGT